MSGNSLARRACAEIAGTALLVFIGAGSVAAGGSLLAVALAFGFVVIACVYALGPISGSHINPAVTAAFAATGRFPWREVPAYVAAQFAGAAVGALLLWGVFGDRNGFGAASFDESRVSWGSAFLAEALAAGILVFVVLGAIDRRAPEAVAGIAIGLALAAIILVIGPVTCSATNPARVFGPLLAQTIDGSGAHNWLQLLGVYAPAELLGGVLAALGYDALAPATGGAQPRDSTDSARRAGSEGSPHAARPRHAPDPRLLGDDEGVRARVPALSRGGAARPGDR